MHTYSLPTIEVGGNCIVILLKTYYGYVDNLYFTDFVNGNE